MQIHAAEPKYLFPGGKSLMNPRDQNMEHRLAPKSHGVSSPVAHGQL